MSLFFAALSALRSGGLGIEISDGGREQMLCQTFIWVNLNRFYQGSGKSLVNDR
jgi:hypothetical protein